MEVLNQVLSAAAFKSGLRERTMTKISVGVTRLADMLTLEWPVVY